MELPYVYTESFTRINLTILDKIFADGQKFSLDGAVWNFLAFWLAQQKISSSPKVWVLSLFFWSIVFTGKDDQTIFAIDKTPVCRINLSLEFIIELKFTSDEALKPKTIVNVNSVGLLTLGLSTLHWLLIKFFIIYSEDEYTKTVISIRSIHFSWFIEF